VLNGKHHYVTAYSKAGHLLCQVIGKIFSKPVLESRYLRSAKVYFDVEFARRTTYCKFCTVEIKIIRSLLLHETNNIGCLKRHICLSFNAQLELMTYLLFQTNPRITCSESAHYLRHSLPYLLTHSMEQSPSWGASRFAVSQEIRHVIEPEGLLPHSQVPATCLYPDTAQSIKYLHIPLPEVPP
jgi:hypothetical protein